MNFRQRVYAIFKALYFGFLPWWFYEKECHYARDGEGMGIRSHLDHLIINLFIIKSLVLKTEHKSTHKFHKMKIKKWIRWRY